MNLIGYKYNFILTNFNDYYIKIWNFIFINRLEIKVCYYCFYIEREIDLERLNDLIKIVRLYELRIKYKLVYIIRECIVFIDFLKEKGDLCSISF